MNEELIRVKIHTMDGQKHLIEVLSDFTTPQLIVRELSEALNWSRMDADGNQSVWELHEIDTGHHLDPEETLAASGVKDGHRLALFWNCRVCS